MTYVVTWDYNGKHYRENYPTLVQAMMRLWRLGSNNTATISVKD